MSKPIDFAQLLGHIAEARAIPTPNQAQIAELERALKRYRPEAIRAATTEWLRVDVKAIGRLPLPGELLPYIQSHQRRLIAEERNLQPLEGACVSCEDTGWVLEEQPGHMMFAERCSCQRTSA